MLDSDRGRFLDLIGGVHDFYGKELTRFASDVWWRCCQASDFETISLAFSNHLSDPERGQWMPKPADLVRQLDGTQSDRSRRAWGKVLDASQRVGAYQSIAFDEAAIHAAIEDVGGWIAVCRTELDELPHLERRFCAAYRAYIAPGKLTSWSPKLLGQHDIDNNLKGYENQGAVLIGNAEKAREVLRLGSVGTRTQVTRIGDAIPSVHRIAK